MKRISFLMIAALMLAFSLPAAAHGPTPRKVEETVTIDAPPEKVWEAIKNFGAIADWHDGLKSSEGDPDEASGGERTVTLPNDGKLVDSLDEYDAENMTYSYRLETPDIEHFPVSFYSATISLAPADGGTKVDWIGRFYRADTGNFPSESQNDEAATAAMTEFFAGGLKSLKAKVEGQ